jgi:tetratricopeptide (TPR) repeat protein
MIRYEFSWPLAEVNFADFQAKWLQRREYLQTKRGAGDFELRRDLERGRLVSSEPWNSPDDANRAYEALEKRSWGLTAAGMAGDFEWKTVDILQWGPVDSGHQHQIDQFDATLDKARSVIAEDPNSLMRRMELSSHMDTLVDQATELDKVEDVLAFVELAESRGVNLPRHKGELHWANDDLERAEDAFREGLSLTPPVAACAVPLSLIIDDDDVAVATLAGVLRRKDFEWGGRDAEPFVGIVGELVSLKAFTESRSILEEMVAGGSHGDAVVAYKALAELEDADPKSPLTSYDIYLRATDWAASHGDSATALNFARDLHRELLNQGDLNSAQSILELGQRGDCAGLSRAVQRLGAGDNIEPIENRNNDLGLE